MSVPISFDEVARVRAEARRLMDKSRRYSRMAMVLVGIALVVQAITIVIFITQ